MEKFTTELMGYEVVETMYGLDVYENGDYVCELMGKTLEDFTYDEVVNSEELEDVINEELEYQKFQNEINI